jgi:hypothetical protein
MDNFTNNANKERKLQELLTLRQGDNETVEAYTQRATEIIRIATRGDALPERYKVNHYIKGLRPNLMKEVLINQPNTLTDAIDRAKLIERINIKTTENLVLN